MKQINVTTKRGGAFLASYNRSDACTLSDVYGRYSTDKSRAEYECRRRMVDESGEDFRIMSYNTFGFSCGWRVAGGLRVETPQNSYFIAF